MVAGSKQHRRIDMATIGTFKKAGNEIHGEIVTLSVQTKNVRIVPETNRSNDNAPSHRISRSSWMIRASARRSTPTSSTMKTAKATPLSGPAAASKTGNKNSDEPRPAMPGGVCNLNWWELFGKVDIRRKNFKTTNAAF